MSYTDDEPVCDICLRSYPKPWPDGFYAPWPANGPIMEPDGRVPPDRADTFDVCEPCLQSIVMSAPLTRSARALAVRSRERWLASERLLAELKSIAALDAA